VTSGAACAGNDCVSLNAEKEQVSSFLAHLL
jgi:hypothetical protein